MCLERQIDNIYKYYLSSLILLYLYLYIYLYLILLLFLPLLNGILSVSYRYPIVILSVS